MIELATVLRAVIGAFEETGTPYVVVGSVASTAWGVARTTRDVDIVALATVDAVDRLADRLDPAHFYVPVDQARRVAAEGGAFNVLHPRSGGKIDVFVVTPDDEFTRSRLARRVRADVFGVDAWIDSAEDTVLAKLRWRLDSRSEVQWRDCVEIAAVTPLDRAYLDAWAPRLGLTDDLHELLAEVDRLRQGATSPRRTAE